MWTTDKQHKWRWFAQIYKKDLRGCKAVSVTSIVKIFIFNVVVKGGLLLFTCLGHLNFLFALEE